MLMFPYKVDQESMTISLLTYEIMSHSKSAHWLFLQSWKSPAGDMWEEGKNEQSESQWGGREGVEEGSLQELAWVPHGPAAPSMYSIDESLWEKRHSSASTSCTNWLVPTLNFRNFASWLLNMAIIEI